MKEVVLVRIGYVMLQGQTIPELSGMNNRFNYAACALLVDEGTCSISPSLTNPASHNSRRERRRTMKNHHSLLILQVTCVILLALF